MLIDEAEARIQRVQLTAKYREPKHVGPELDVVKRCAVFRRLAWDAVVD